MVQNKQANCAHLPYKPPFKLVLQNGTLKNEGCADTLMKRDNVCQRTAYLKSFDGSYEE